jgi:hypothetical protein
MQFVVAIIYIAGKSLFFEAKLSELKHLLNFFSPNGYTCDTKAGRCNKGELSIPFYIKTESKLLDIEEENASEGIPSNTDIICPVIQFNKSNFSFP